MREKRRRCAWLDEYWRFYLAKSGREDLLRRTVRFDPRNDDVQEMPWQSVLLANFEPSRDEPLIVAGKLFRIAVITELDAAPSFSILGRN
jgi:hypothetical protein